MGDFIARLVLFVWLISLAALSLALLCQDEMYAGGACCLLTLSTGGIIATVIWAVRDTRTTPPNADTVDSGWPPERS